MAMCVMPFGQGNKYVNGWLGDQEKSGCLSADNMRDIDSRHYAHCSPPSHCATGTPYTGQKEANTPLGIGRVRCMSVNMMNNTRHEGQAG